jgi:hypothetical protein
MGWIAGGGRRREETPWVSPHGRSYRAGAPFRDPRVVVIVIWILTIGIALVHVNTMVESRGLSRRLWLSATLSRAKTLAGPPVTCAHQPLASKGCLIPCFRNPLDAGKKYKIRNI